MVNRRAFLATVGGGLLAAPLAGGAQQTEKVFRIGYLSGNSAEGDTDLRSAFRQGFAELGYVEGKGSVIEYRYAAGRAEQIPALAAELVQSKVDVVVASATTVFEAKTVLAGVPTVFVIADDPVRAGLVASLARPAGHMTGLSRSPTRWTAGSAALRIGRTATGSRPPSRPPAPCMDQLPPTIDTAARSPIEALVVLGSPIFRGSSARTAQLVAKTRLPAASAWKEFPEAGGLLSYGTNVAAMFRRAALFVDKILKGAKPGDLPVEQATTFELVINLKTAKKLGLTIPGPLRLRADHVIE